ncbi:MAG: histidine triad nucleotide-binding protein [Cyanobacteriota/Melainabacteria group bacterium]|nr:histidine triad nucleotide-binding protein [Cyanobacteria bacterium HKST-UBA01]MCB9471417.1 histidine triad nucleotide-binding protein [Candidatus Obscuribacterales bacterium]
MNAESTTNLKEESENCLFCKIVKGQIPADIVSQGDNWLAFRDINPQAPSHILVIPKNHVANVTECNEAAELGSLFQAASGVARDENLDQGFRLVVNTGEHGGQTVFHLHIHILGGRSLTWPPG